MKNASMALETFTFCGPNRVRISVEMSEKKFGDVRIEIENFSKGGWMGVGFAVTVFIYAFTLLWNVFVSLRHHLSPKWPFVDENVAFRCWNKTFQPLFQPQKVLETCPRCRTTPEHYILCQTMSFSKNHPKMSKNVQKCPKMHKIACLIWYVILWHITV